MTTSNIGAQLRSTREALGLSMAAIAQRTRVQPRIIAAIERNEIAEIPPKPYGRGFVRAYAKEVGLDPDLVVRDYFGQFPPAPAHHSGPEDEPEPWPVRGSWLVPAAGMMVLALVALAMSQGERTEVSPANVPVPVGTAGAGSDASASARAIGMGANRDRAGFEEAVPARHAEATGASAPHELPLSIVLDVDRTCWIAARADGQRVLYQLMQPGTQHTIRAAREVAIRAGDAGAVRLTINGRDAGVFGRDGEVRDRRFPAPLSTSSRARQP